MTPGTYRVGELAPAGWDLTGNDCHGLVVAAGATVPCTITNTKKGRPTSSRRLRAAQTFNYTVDGPTPTGSPSVTRRDGTGDDDDFPI